MTASAPTHNARQATLLVAFMWVAYFLNYADRQAVFAMFPALKSGLGMTDKPVRPKRFVVRPHNIGVRPGVDLDRMNQLVDDLDAEATAAKLRK